MGNTNNLANEPDLDGLTPFVKLVTTFNFEEDKTKHVKARLQPHFIALIERFLEVGADPCILTPKFRGIYNSICTRVNELEEIELFKIIMSKVENKLDLANIADKNKIFPLWKMIKNFNI